MDTIKPPADRNLQIGQLYELLRLIGRDILNDKGQLFAEHSLSRTEGEILFLVAHKPDGPTIKELAASLSITHGAVSQFVENLSQKGLLKRKQDLHDKRVTRVVFTEKAIEQFKKFEQTHFHKISQMFEGLTNKEIGQLTSSLGKVRTVS